MAKHFFIIRGPCGVGKSTVGKEFAAKHGFAFLEKDVFVWDFNPVRTKTPVEYRLVYENMRSVLKNYFTKGYSVVLEGDMVPWAAGDPLDVKKFIRMAARYGYTVHNVLLTADQTICMARMKKRKMVCSPATVQKTWSSVHAETYDVTLDAKRPLTALVKELDKQL